MSIKVSTYLLCLSVVLGLAGCSSSLDHYVNYADYYNTSTKLLNPKFTVYNESNDSTTVYFKVKSSELLYTRKDRVEDYKSKVLLRYQVVNVEESRIVVDSASRIISDQVSVKREREILGSFKIKAPEGNDYKLSIAFLDVNRKHEHQEEIVLKKKSKKGRQYFIAKNSEGELLFDNYLHVQEKCTIESNLNKGKQVYLRSYRRDFPLAAPPFSLGVAYPFKYRPDYTEVQEFNDLGVMEVEMIDTGFVHFQVDTSSHDGFTLYQFTDEFPRVQRVEQLIYPLRFISTKSEYNALMNAEDKKLALDKFWLAKAGSEERGKELIRKYYNRVQDANNYFSSYTEGWRTDRGMISIIFGKPNVVTRTRREEIWSYGEEPNNFAMRFTFAKIDNPFSDNDYKLERNQNHRSIWYRAVDAWRSGRVYWIE